LLALLAARMLALRWPLAATGIAAVAVLDALYRIHVGSHSDLLLPRLRLRYVILAGTGVYALAVLAAEATVARGSQAAVGLEAVNDVGLYLLTAAVCVVAFRIEPDFLRAGSRPVSASEPDPVLSKKLERLIEEEQIFKTDGLTIGVLAERLGEHEYKVRQLINTSLGFRNFGAFLNHYRVREACKVLADPAQRQLGIAEIAYRHGYSSLGPFNRAFKEIVGQTPTEYRKAALDQPMLADSEIGQTSSKRS
jgi:AraC-like DNA-binding protein